MAATVTPDAKQMKSFLIGLLNTPSPTGFTQRALDYIENALSALPLTLRRTQKGALVAEWAGRASTAPRGLTAHVDTLGAMVKEIKDNGRLAYPVENLRFDQSLVEALSGVRGLGRERRTAAGYFGGTYRVPAMALESFCFIGS